MPSVTHPERLVGLHFFNPVHRMPLVEVVQCHSTSDRTLQAAVSLTQALGKTPVVVKDAPGFLVNRVLVPYIIEAGHLFASGHDPHEIDEAMLNAGMPMGPLRLLDEVGLDVGLHVAKTLADAFPDRVKIPEMLQTLVDEGHLGRKAGKGIFLYNKKSQQKLPINSAAKKLQANQPKPVDISAVLIRNMVEEAERCLDEGIVDSAANANLAMILGTGYAPFSGGPLEW